MNDKFGTMLNHYIECEQENARIITEEILFSDENKLPLNLHTFVRELSEKGREDNCHPCNKLHCELGADMWNCKFWNNELDSIYQELLLLDIDNSLALYFFLHCSAYERWEESFNYDCIGCGLVSSKLIADFTANNHPQIDAYTKNLFEALSLLAQRVLHQSLIENGMIANDPLEMKYHAERYLKLSHSASKSLSVVIKSPDRELSKFAKKLDDFFTQSVKHHDCLVRTTEYMNYCQKDRNRFYIEYPSFRSQLKECISYLEKYENNVAGDEVKSPDYESASEMRGHLVTLDRFAAQRGSPRLRIDQIDGQLMVGFYLDVSEFQWEDATQKSKPSEKDSTSPNNEISSMAEISKSAIKPDDTKEKAPNIFDKLRKKINLDHCIGSIPILTASKDPAPDILETSIGSKHFANILIEFPSIIINKLAYQKFDLHDPIFPLKLKPKLLHCLIGVGMIYFEIEKPNDRNKTIFTVSDFQILKNMLCPHAARYEITFENDKNPNRHWGRLPELVEEIYNNYCTLVKTGLSEEPEHWMESSQTWFTSFRFYNITDENGGALESKALTAHPEWPGIWSYHRADKSSVDDWVGISLDGINMSNLAQVRGHKGDFFGISENYAITFMRDDPEFIVLQYIETAKWVFLIKILIIYCLAESDKPLENLKEIIIKIKKIFNEKPDKIDDTILDDLESEVHDMHLNVQRFGALALSALDHVNSATVSQYADHSLLLRKAFASISLPELTNDLQNKVKYLSEGQQALTEVIQRIQDYKESKRQTLLNILVASLGVIQLVIVLDVIFKIIAKDQSVPIWTLLIDSIPLILLAGLLTASNNAKFNKKLEGYKNRPIITAILKAFRIG
jgi:hypothetical protein